MSRIKDLFANNQARIAYLTVGDGGREYTLKAALALIQGGANMLELGLPFSDPIADGPIIQAASQRALAQGTNVNDVLWLIKAIRAESNIPLILFSYLNPVLAQIKSNFLKLAQQAGLDGLLLVDCPFEEAQTIAATCRDNSLDLIYIISNNTSVARLKKITANAQGFLYYACQKGTTGMRSSLPEDFKEKIKTIKTFTSIPVVVGFGISNAVMVKEVLQAADGVVIGSYFVELAAENQSLDNLTRQAKSLF